MEDTPTFEETLEKSGLSSDELYDTVLRLKDALLNIVCECSEFLKKILDDIRFEFEDILCRLSLPTCGRYQIVRFLSKCSGIERKCLWKMTRPMYLARSNI